MPELVIEKLVHQGYGLGFLDSRSVFVENAAPGDLLQIELTRNTRHFSYGKIVNIISPGPGRVEAQCSAFGQCGGCNWLHLDYQTQIDWKSKIAGEIFRKIHNSAIIPCEPSPLIKGYRNKTFLPVMEKSGEIIIGMYARQSHNVIPHAACQIHPALFDRVCPFFTTYLRKAQVQIYNELKNSGQVRHLGLRYSFSTGELLMIIVTRTAKLPFTRQLTNTILSDFPEVTGIIQNINPEKTNRILGTESKLIYGRDYLWEEIKDLRFRVSYDSFFQVNSSIIESLYNHILDHVPLRSRVLDAYCGTGSIGIFVAARAEKVWGVEVNQRAIDDARLNCQTNRVVNCEFISGRVEDQLEELIAGKGIDTVIFDPPRQGLTPEILDVLHQCTPARIIYVSCDPATQERDVTRLLSAGYRILDIHCFDLFPQTYHQECVVVLVKE
ncbi:MAG: 23S rRNA (uracil(1939)-C(5))-methyltransferase RlmD [Candidatus Cloacimonetes bacterium]|nr:23S rRNA (uracil(1939)-C(5))-methyltransferase RlmD [Candidatus Cloacimonadota bacterium]